MQNLIFLAEGTEPTEGGHAPENPLGFVPVEFVLSLVVFGLLLFLIWKFVAPRFEQTFAERTQAIEGGIAAAESKQAEADAKLAELEKQLADARHEAARIREEAREQGAQIVAEMREHGPGRVRAHRRARQGPDRGRAPAGGHLAPCRGRRPRHRSGRSHRRREPGGRGSSEPRRRALPRRPRSRQRSHVGERQLMMRGASADAYAAAAAVLPGTGDLGRVGQDLFGTADLLRAEPGLRRVATDVSIRGEAKADLLRGVLGGKVSSEALEVVTTAVSQRWTSGRDLRRRPRAARVVVATVRSTGGDAGRLEDEVFAVGRLVQANPELRDALSDPARSRADKAALVRGLLGDKVLPATVALVQQSLSGSHRTVAVALAAYQKVAAEVRGAGSRDRARRPPARRRRP